MVLKKVNWRVARYMFFMMLGLDLGGFFVVMVVLPASLLVPHFRALTARRRLLLPALALR